MRFFSALLVTLALAAPNCRADTLAPYTDPAQQTKLAFGQRSHWAQPWRAYLETVPASVFLNGTGLCYSDAGDPDVLLKHFARHGIAHIRLEIGWGSVNYDDETQIANADHLRQILAACRKNGVRPLILLNSHQGVPCPVRLFERTVTQAAKKGDRTVTLDKTDDLIPGRSGLSQLTDYWAAEALVTAQDGRTMTLSKPLPKDIAAGTRVPMATLKYRPFSPPDTPEYRETVAGWLRYVGVVGALARSALGTVGKPDAGFDLEVWNELTFGSQFLSINNYEQPKLRDYKEDGIWASLVRETAAYVQANPADFRRVLVCDGFSNTIPWPASSLEPPGVAALSKHPYAGRRRFPDPKARGETLDARFQPNKTGWEPTYTELFPEYSASALQTEHVIRDTSPIVSDLYGVKHGRLARTPPVALWITEVNIAPVEDDPKVDLATARHLKAKTTARYFCFFLNKGVTLMTLYNAFGNGGGERELGVASDDLKTWAQKPGATLPADDRALTSPALRVTGGIARALRIGLDPALTRARRLVLRQLSDTHDAIQWAGDGTPAHPPLYDRDVFAFLPFQVNKAKFVIPYYVMTRDVRHVYDAAKTGGRQFDMPAEAFTLTLTGVHGKTARVTAFDPLNERSVPVTKVRGDDRSLVVRVQAVDYPYLLTIQE